MDAIRVKAGFLAVYRFIAEQEGQQWMALTCTANLAEQL